MSGTVIGECRGDPYSLFASTKATCQRSQVPGGDKKKDVVETWKSCYASWRNLYVKKCIPDSRL